MDVFRNRKGETMKYNIYRFISVGARDGRELSWYPVNMEYLYQITSEKEEDVKDICNKMTSLEKNPSLYPGAKEVSYWYERTDEDIYPFFLN